MQANKDNTKKETPPEDQPSVHVIAVDSGDSAEAAFRWASRALPRRVGL